MNLVSVTHTRWAPSGKGSRKKCGNSHSPLTSAKKVCLRLLEIKYERLFLYKSYDTWSWCNLVATKRVWEVSISVKHVQHCACKRTDVKTHQTRNRNWKWNFRKLWLARKLAASETKLSTVIFPQLLREMKQSPTISINRLGIKGLGWCDHVYHSLPCINTKQSRHILLLFWFQYNSLYISKFTSSTPSSKIFNLTPGKCHCRSIL